MILPPWHEEPLGKKHGRDSFDCGEEALNTYFREHARKSHDLGGAKTFLAIADDSSGTILGYYSLSPTSLEYALTPEIANRGLARHDVPGFRLARLAVDCRVQGRGLGGQLLLAAGKRCLLASTQVGGVIMVIDAKNPKMAEWYTRWGAVALLDGSLSLVLPLATLETALKAAGKY